MGPPSTANPPPVIVPVRKSRSPPTSRSSAGSADHRSAEATWSAGERRQERAQRLLVPTGPRRPYGTDHAATADPPVRRDGRVGEDRPAVVARFPQGEGAAAGDRGARGLSSAVGVARRHVGQRAEPAVREGDATAPAYPERSPPAR